MKALTLALVLFLLLHSTADSYVLTGVKWDHTVITHGDSPELARAIGLWADVSGITDGGISAHPDIISSIAKLPSNIGGYAGWASMGGIITACSIVVSDVYPTNMTVWVHEVGHCLGLDHSLDPHAIMFYNGGDRIGIQPDDAAAIQSIYGPKPAAPQLFRLILPMLAQT